MQLHMSTQVGQKVVSIFETKNLTKEQKRKYIRLKNEINKKLKNSNPHYKYARSDVVEQIIKGCRGVKKTNDGVKRQDKEKQRENFRQLLGFKEYEVFESK